jgi:hypothetical protein
MRTRGALAFVTACLGALGACGGGNPSGGAGPSSCPGAAAIWAASDYSSSAVGSLSPSGALTAVVGAVDLGADPALSVSGGRAFYVARDLDAVFELDGCGAPKQRFSAGIATPSGSSDPYAVAVSSDGDLWIPLFLAAAVLVLHPDGSVTQTIDLSAYDSDGNPDATDIAIVDTPAGEKAFVTLARLNPYPQSVQPSWMLRIDVATARVEAEIVLAGRNPFSVKQAASILWLADPGNFDDATESDAGIERFDTSNSTTALVTSETQLGGSVAEVAVSGSCAAAIVAGPVTNVNPTALVPFDPSTGTPESTVSDSPLSTPGFDLEGLAWVNGDLWVGDRQRGANGYPVHDFAASATCALTERSSGLVLPLPPIAMTPLL